jgi:hypothetical protein
MNSLLLVLLAGVYLRNYNPALGVLIVLSVALFAVLDRNLLGWRERRLYLIQLLVIVLVIVLLVVTPTLLEIAVRHGGPAYDHIHDGAIQTEEAAKFLMAGQNPYGADYSQTPMALWHYAGINPALHHNAYLPFTFLLAIPFSLLAQAVLGWFDLRFIFMPVLIVMILMLPQLTDSVEKKLGLVIVLGLNPLFVPFFIEGRNDVLILFGIVLVIFLLQRGHISSAAFILGLAGTAKQTAWLLVPFFFAYLFWGPIKNQAGTFVRRAVLPLVLPLLLFLLPFVLWNMSTFVEDTLVFVSQEFPVGGYGLGQLLLLTGILPSDQAPFPFTLLEILVNVPVVILLWRYQRQHPTLRVLVGAGATLTVIFAFFNRVFQDNYLGYSISLAALAYFLPEGAVDA